MGNKKEMLYPEEIEILNFSILSGEINNPEGFDNEYILKHDFSVDLKLGFNLEDSLIKSSIRIDVQTDCEGKNEEEARSGFEFLFLYRYEKLLDLVARTKNKEEVVLHPHLGNAISAITYSTSRGVLMTRFQGTAFKDFILPVIPPDSLLE
ncbi:MAG: hypothetical protein JXR03_10315 [Cyclobacteriaceae bacterium]